MNWGKTKFPRCGRTKRPGGLGEWANWINGKSRPSGPKNETGGDYTTRYQCREVSGWVCCTNNPVPSAQYQQRATLRYQRKAAGEYWMSKHLVGGIRRWGGSRGSRKRLANKGWQSKDTGGESLGESSEVLFLGEMAIRIPGAKCSTSLLLLCWDEVRIGYQYPSPCPRDTE